MVWLRRSVTVPAIAIVCAVTTIALPLLMLLALGFDALRTMTTRRRWVAWRLLVFFWIYTIAEVFGLLSLLAVWFAYLWHRLGWHSLEVSQAELRRWTNGIAWLWARTLFAAMSRLFALRYQVQGQSCLRPGPFVLLSRHTSLADVLLPFVFMTDHGAISPRYVLKRELAWDPCLDVGAHRMGSYFVDRSGQRTGEELAHLRDMGRELAADEAVVMFPEGTRFTQAKRSHLIETGVLTGAVRAKQAMQFRHVLPPHPGGALALLESGADVVVCAHHGFDGLAQVKDLLRGTPVGRTISIRYWRVSAHDIPHSREARIAWLQHQWHLIDDWLDTMETAT